MYSVALRTFIRFAEGQGHFVSLPSTLSQVIDFISYLSLNNFASSTIKSYISALSYKSKISNATDYTDFLVVKKMLSGLTRMDNRRDLRLPVTFDILVKIVHALPYICYSNFESVLFGSIYTLAIYAFLRVGEVVQVLGHDIGHALQLHHIKFYPNHVELYIPHSKTDQQGYGHIIVVPSSNKDICPVRALKQYNCIRPKFQGSFFRHVNGVPVTRYQFTKVLKTALSHCNMAPGRFTSHSFRIGAATSAALAGWSDSQISECGRWKSNAFRRYIRIPTDKL